MRTAQTATTTLIASLAPLSTAWAAGPREDHSGILVWAFLGMCALIVVAQLAPAMMLLVGMAKGLAGRRVEREVTIK